MTNAPLFRVTCPSQDERIHACIHAKPLANICTLENLSFRAILIKASFGLID